MPALTPPVQPGAEPIDLPGGRVGVLMSHGFTGCNQSMRPWAEFLGAAGLTVVAPRLPGHGTTIKDMNTTTFDDWYGEVERSFDALRARCDSVFAMGLSMGGTLVLRLAEKHPDQVAGVVTVNASLATARKDAKLLPLMSKLVAAFPGIGSDIKKPGVTEQAYPKIPLKAAYSLQQAWPVVRADLPRITCPVLVYRSAVDHVVEPISGEALRAGCVHAEERILHDSYHVATLDNDATTIFEGSLEFVRQHASAAAG
ncbi:MAG: putative esterase/lipase [Frankiales bacterium]|nr:putative esterase/lipase [Frankiales bacterium]